MSLRHPFEGCAAGCGGTRCCLHRNALHPHGREGLSAEPCGGGRHAIPAVECSLIARAAIGISDDYTLMVSP